MILILFEKLEQFQVVNNGQIIIPVQAQTFESCFMPAKPISRNRVAFIGMFNKSTRTCVKNVYIREFAYEKQVFLALDEIV